MRQHVPPAQLWNEFHGDLDFDYDHSVYWPALLKLTEERYAERWERWVKAGKAYGESEVYLRGGDAPSVTQVSASEAPQSPGKGVDLAEKKQVALGEKEEADPVMADESKPPVQAASA